MIGVLKLFNLNHVTVPIEYRYRLENIQNFATKENNICSSKTWSLYLFWNLFIKYKRHKIELLFKQIQLEMFCSGLVIFLFRRRRKCIAVLLMKFPYPICVTCIKTSINSSINPDWLQQDLHEIPFRLTPWTIRRIVYNTYNYMWTQCIHFVKSCCS